MHTNTASIFTNTGVALRCAFLAVGLAAFVALVFANVAGTPSWALAFTPQSLALVGLVFWSAYAGGVLARTPAHARAELKTETVDVWGLGADGQPVGPLSSIELDLQTANRIRQFSAEADALSGSAQADTAFRIGAALIALSQWNARLDSARDSIRVGGMPWDYYRDNANYVLSDAEHGIEQLAAALTGQGIPVHAPAVGDQGQPSELTKGAGQPPP